MGPGRGLPAGARLAPGGHEIGMAVNVSARQLDADESSRRCARASTAVSTGRADPGDHRDGADAGREQTARRLQRSGARRAGRDRRLRHRLLIAGTSAAVPRRRAQDRPLVHLGPADDQEGETLLHALVQLGKALSIETLAEGIEHQRELSLLQDEQCDSGQGFLFARPLDAAATEAFLRDSANKDALAS